jgi:hypothetical protein
MKYKKSLPRFALDALNEASEIKFPNIASGLLTVETMRLLGIGAGAGLAILLLTWRGMGVWRKFTQASSSPFHYLTKIQASGASLVFPPISGK